MPRVVRLTQQRLKEVLDFDPETGVFTWKEALHARGIRRGRRAGSVDPNGHRYIRIDKEDFLAQRLAWFWMHNEWPRRLTFKDGDQANCAIVNLTIGRYVTSEHDSKSREGRIAYGREHRKQFPDFYKNAYLKRSFGIGLEEYSKMLAAQNGVCAVCGGAEVSVMRGKVKALAVDHNHKTGEVRELLCQACNVMIGCSREAPEVLKSAAAYLERHATKPGDTNMLRDLAPSSAALN